MIFFEERNKKSGLKCSMVGVEIFSEKMDIEFLKSDFIFNYIFIVLLNPFLLFIFTKQTESAPFWQWAIYFQYRLRQVKSKVKSSQFSLVRSSSPFAKTANNIKPSVNVKHLSSWPKRGKGNGILSASSFEYEFPV